MEAQIPRWFSLSSELTPKLADAKEVGMRDSCPRPLRQGMWTGSWKYTDADTYLPYRAKGDWYALWVSPELMGTR